jgi:tetratricopeptide (TPR) repeat protein
MMRSPWRNVTTLSASWTVVICTAQNMAKAHLQRSLNAGKAAYPRAAYNIALAHLLLGRVLHTSGAPAEALVPLVEAQHRFQALVDSGDSDVADMVLASITGQAICFTSLGRLEEAADAFNQMIMRAEQHDAKRDVAVNKANLGFVRLLQRRYQEALALYIETRELFKSQGDLRAVATAWHQIGTVYRKQEQFDAAERAYRESLSLRVQHHDRAGEAGSLLELGNLYADMERREEAVTFYRQAVDIYVSLQDPNNEGFAHGNLAGVLIKLHSYDEARVEVQRAIECTRPFGHAAEPWKSWAILFDLEVAVENKQAALAARQQAIDAYYAYRCTGGEPQGTGGQLCEIVARAIQQREITKAKQELARYDSADFPASFKVFLAKLHAILNGDRNPVLADDPELHYADTAEVRLVLERIES